MDILPVTTITTMHHPEPLKDVYIAFNCLPVRINTPDGNVVVFLSDDCSPVPDRTGVYAQ